MKRFTSRQIAFAGILAALYAAITIIWPFSYGAVQFRLAEALTVLCCFSPTAIFGMVIGCIGANVISTVGAFDILFGSVATLLSCLVTSKIKRAWLVPIPAVLFNALIVGAEIAFFIDERAFWPAFGLNVLSIAAGETAVMVLLGIPLFLYLKRSKLGKTISSLGSTPGSDRR